MFKKLLMLLLLAIPVSLLAQGKIAYLNAEEIFAKMPEFEQAQKQLEVKSATLKESIDAIEGEFNALVEEYSKSTDEPTAEIVVDREKKMQDLQERYQRFVQNSQVEFEQEQQKLLAPLREKMQKAIQDVGDENSYTYIADVAMFMYVGKDAIDATKQVKVKLGILN